MEINIAHLYPDLLNLYGDRGNIITLKRRCELRGITANIHEYELADGIDFANTDIIFIAARTGSKSWCATACANLRTR